MGAAKQNSSNREVHSELHGESRLEKGEERHCSV